MRDGRRDSSRLTLGGSGFGSGWLAGGSFAASTAELPFDSAETSGASSFAATFFATRLRVVFAAFFTTFFAAFLATFFFGAAVDSSDLDVVSAASIEGVFLGVDSAVGSVVSEGTVDLGGIVG